MLSFDEVMRATLRREGWPKYTNRASDKGGPTKGGITLETLWRYRGHPVSPEDVANLTREEVCDIYRVLFYDRWAFVADEPLRLLLFDYGVHSDTRAIKTLQRCINAIPDGVIGEETRRLTAEAIARDRATLYGDVWRGRLELLCGLVLDAQAREFLRTHPTAQLHNMLGWMRRLGEFV
jgi:lysozyme family protein